ncbi:MAG: hypothetical protein K0R08_1989, partial [Solimicrobium sp.]|nr:hypothetical protein [Solimicrobium sp.]
MQAVSKQSFYFPQDVSNLAGRINANKNKIDILRNDRFLQNILILLDNEYEVWGKWDIDF